MAGRRYFRAVRSLVVAADDFLPQGASHPLPGWVTSVDQRRQWMAGISVFDTFQKTREVAQLHGLGSYVAIIEVPEGHPSITVGAAGRSGHRTLYGSSTDISDCEVRRQSLDAPEPKDLDDVL